MKKDIVIPVWYFISLNVTCAIGWILLIKEIT